MIFENRKKIINGKVNSVNIIYNKFVIKTWKCLQSIWPKAETSNLTSELMTIRLPRFLVVFNNSCNNKWPTSKTTAMKVHKECPPNIEILNVGISGAEKRLYK